MNLRNSRGLALVETSVAIAALICILSGGFTTLYVVFARVWIEREAYETLVCLASRSSALSCEQRSRDRVRHALPVGDLSRLETSREFRKVRVRIQFRLGRREIAREDISSRLPLQLPGVQ